MMYKIVGLLAPEEDAERSHCGVSLFPNGRRMWVQ